MRRLLCVLSCLLFLLPGSPARAGQNYQDMWWLPSESGWGLMVLHQADTISAVLFHYRADRSPAWFLLSNAPRTPGEHFSGTLFEVNGPPLFGAFDPASVQARAAGTMRISFEDANTAALTYTIDGRTTSRSIQRITFAALDIDGGYFGAQLGVLRCDGNPQIGNYTFPTNIVIEGGSVRSTQHSNSLLDRGPVFCNWGGVPQQQHGSRITGSGMVFCSGNDSGLALMAEMEIEDLRILDHAVTLNYRARVTYPAANTTCTERGTISGTRLRSPD